MSVKEVALKSGVSVSTVYRVLQEDKVISPETTRLVAETIKKMGIEAKHLKIRKRQNSRSNSFRYSQVAFILIGQETFSADLAMIRGLEGELKRHGLKLIFTQTQDYEGLRHVIRSSKFDGVILHGWRVGEQYPFLNDIKEIPMIWLLTHSEEWGDQVQPDNIAIGKMAADYVLEKGYETVSCIIPEYNNLAFEQRFASFQSVLDGPRVKVKTYRPQQKKEVHSIKHILTRLMPPLVEEFASEIEPPEALFVMDALYLSPISSFLAVHNRTSDVDMLVCAPDPSAIQGIHSPLNIIDINLVEIGKQAAKLLLWRIQDKQPATRVTMQVEPVFYPDAEH